jgi:hypothetical protein
MIQLTLAQIHGDEREMQEVINDSVCTRIRVCIPAIVKSFDPAKQTVTAQISVKELIIVDNKLYTTKICVIPDVPIKMPRAGGFMLALPVKEGDECLLMFADCCIDEWYKNGGEDNEQVFIRRHDLSDCFALMGVWSQPRVIAEYPTETAQLRSDDGNVMIELSDDEVKIKAPTLTVEAQTINVEGGASLSIKGDGVTNIESEGITNVKGTQVIIADGIQGVARLGDTVAVDPNTHVGTITSASIKVLAG